VGVVNDQVRRLILFVLGAGMIEIGQLVEDEFAVAFRRTEQVSFVTTVAWNLGELLHVLMPRMRGIAVPKSAATGELLQASMDHPDEESLFESLMEVANLPQLFFNPTRVDALLKPCQRLGGRIVGLKRFTCSFGSQHSALDGKMNPFQALRI